MAQNRLYGEGLYGDGLYGLDLDSSVELTLQDSTVNGIDITFTAADANGNYFLNNLEKTSLVYAKNDSGVDIDITVYSNTKCSQGDYHNYVVTIGAGEETLIGSFSNRKRTTSYDNKVYLWYESVASLTLAIININN